MEVVEVREPGGTPLSEAVRKVALDPDLHVAPVAELFLILAARADLVTSVIRPALDAGHWVVSDRFDISTQVYQVAGRGLPSELVMTANELATGGLTADLTIVLDIPVELGIQRKSSLNEVPDRLEREALGFHQKVAQAYADTVGPNIVHIDGSQPTGAVADEAWSLVAAHFSGQLMSRAG